LTAKNSKAIREYQFVKSEIVPLPTDHCRLPVAYLPSGTISVTAGAQKRRNGIFEDPVRAIINLPPPIDAGAPNRASVSDGWRQHARL